MRKITLLIIAVLTLFALTGCNRNVATPPVEGTPTPAEGTSTPTPTDSTSPTPAPSASPQSPLGDAFLAYRSILKNNDSLEDFLSELGEGGKKLVPSRFAVLDLVGDETPEVVIELADEYPYFYEVLHYEDGNMHGRVFGIREFNDLKADGTFSWAASAGESGYARLTFDGAQFDFDTFAYTTAEIVEDDITQAYFLNGESITYEQYEAFVTEQLAKPEALWHDYTEENIEAVLSPEA